MSLTYNTCDITGDKQHDVECLFQKKMFWMLFWIGDKRFD